MNAELKADLKRFEKVLTRHESGRSIREKFRDFVELSYCAIAKTMAPDEEAADKLEDRYMRIVNSYRNKDAIRAYPEGLAILSKWNSAPLFTDFLGFAAGELNVLSDDMGQFFTPRDVGRLLAEMTISNAETHQMIADKGFITMGEDAVGAGGLVLAAAYALARDNINPEYHLMVQARDVSAVAYEMCYVQLSLAGIPARVIHGNSLSLETFRYAWTPATLSFYSRHGHVGFDAPKAEHIQPVRPMPRPQEESPVPQPEPDINPPRQLTLF